MCSLTLLGPGPGAADRRSVGEVSLDLLLGSGPGLASESPAQCGLLGLGESKGARRAVLACGIW